MYRSPGLLGRPGYRAVCSTGCRSALEIDRAASSTKYLAYIARWKAGAEDGMRGQTGTSSHIRRYMLDKVGHRCARCGWAEVNPHTGKVPLELEHIDGDYQNNDEGNLTILCPNCHSLTPTYRSLNNGKGRPRKT